MAYLMGIDVGTTGVKTLLIDEAGATVTSSLETYELVTPHPNWAEQDPEDWWRASAAGIRRVISSSGVDPAEITGIGLSGQMHGLVLLDENNEVLRPCILWCDVRTTEQCHEITSKVGAENLIQLTCNPALEGFTAPKLLWVRENEPEIYERARKLLLPKDYLRFRLTGEFASEVSDSSGTLLFDVRNRRWSAEMLRILDIDSALLPKVYESPVVSGRVSRAAATATGLIEGTPVVGGGGDQAAGGVGNGIVRTGIISSTIGTSGVVFAYTDTPTLDPQGRVHTFCHAVPGKWHVMGVTQGAGLSFRWFRDNFAGLELGAAGLLGTDPYDLLVREAEQAPAGCEGLIFLPYLMGERTPHLDANAKGVFFGITGRHNRLHMVRSILEGVTYSLRDSLEILREMGVEVSQVRASGGGGRSELWRQIQADIYEHEVVTINAMEGPAFGVALLAGVGTGVYSSVEQACDATIELMDRVTPLEDQVRAYRLYYPIYRALYPALKPQFDAVSEAVERDLAAE